MSNIASKLAKVINPARIVADSSMLDELSWDALSEGRMHPNHHPELRTPLCAVKPQSTEEVRRIVQFANAENRVADVQRIAAAKGLNYSQDELRRVFGDA